MTATVSTGGQAQPETAVTALTSLGDGRLSYGRDYAGGSDKAVCDRLSAVSTGTLVLSFLVAAPSAALTAAANVLDRRRVHGPARTTD